MADAPRAGLRVPLPHRQELQLQLGGSLARALDWFEGCAGSVAQQSGDALRGLAASTSDDACAACTSAASGKAVGQIRLRMSLASAPSMRKTFWQIPDNLQSVDRCCR